MYEYKLDKHSSAISFDDYQLVVVRLSDKSGNLFKGIAVYPEINFGQGYLCAGFGEGYQPVIIDSQQAALLCHFIEAVVNNSLPKTIEVVTDGPEFGIELNHYNKDWHGGGGYQGKIRFGRSRVKGLGVTLPGTGVTIAKNSLIKIRNHLIEFYQLENMTAIKQWLPPTDYTLLA